MSEAAATTTFLELELTSFCQLACTHCYADSGPARGHGTMAAQDWTRVLDEAPEAGIRGVQFIGGEPTTHPAFPDLLEHAVDLGLGVEVFSNLWRMDEKQWQLCSRPGVSLATSYYSDVAEEHDRVTLRRGSHSRTRGNIIEAVERGIAVRAGVIEVLEGQRVTQARADLESLGVRHVRVDRMRGVGRANGDSSPEVSQLCGRCGRSRAVVLPDGSVAPCVLSRWMIAGNVTQQPLADILQGESMRRLVGEIPEPAMAKCNPNLDGNDCAPAEEIACTPDWEAP